MNEINVKCPYCGYLFKTQNITNSVCEKCNKEFLTDKGAKFYNSFINIEREKVAVAKGEAYLKVDSLLDKIDYYLNIEDFSTAEQLAFEALKLTEVDFRVYMSIVYAKTHNFQNYKDVSHIPFLQKAIELASDEEKAKLKKEYSNFYKKQKMTSEELNDYYLKEESHLYSKLENLLKDGLSVHYKKEKSYKPFTLTSIFSGIIFSFLLIISIILSNEIISVISGLFLIVFAYFLLSAISNKEKINIFNFALDLFDNYKKFNVETESSIKILKEFIEFSIEYLNNSSTISLTPILLKVVELIKTLSPKEFENFALNNKLSKKFIK